MSRCPSCQAQLTPGAAWCPQCYGAVAPAESRPVRLAPATAATLPGRATRWQKTPTTYGPVGRILATLALLVPLSFMVVGGMVFTAAWAGALIWLVVVMPRALRDIWRAGRLPI